MNLRLLVPSALLLLALGGCLPIRQPVGGCPYDEVELSPQSRTPWGTVLEQDMETLTGPFLGTFTWLDGDDVITVPKAGQAIAVEAAVEIDLSTARMLEYIMDPGREVGCEDDRFLVDATISFVRVEDGGVELTVPVSLHRRRPDVQYFGSADIMPVAGFAPGLAPITEHEMQGIFVDVRWRGEDRKLSVELRYAGQTNLSETTASGNFKTFATFEVPE